MDKEVNTAELTTEEQTPEVADKPKTPRKTTKTPAKAVETAEATQVVEPTAVAAEAVAEVTEQVAPAVVENVAAETVAQDIVEPIAEPIVEEKSAEQASDLPADLDGLLEILATDIQQMPLAQLKNRIETIKVLFYKIVRARDEVNRAKFIEQGGAADEYKAEVSPEEARLKELLTIYRTRRDSAVQATEEQKAANYAAKLELIEELKSLVDSTETMGQTFAAFREIQNKWKEIGIVPIAHTKDLWETYHHHTENFYNFIKINKELRDLDLKRNYEAKLELCERAEALMEVESATSAFNELQKLHDLYREAGPVAAEYKEQLWERFKAASSRINKRHQEYYDSLREEQEHNLALKEELCIKVEEFAALPLTSVAEWNSVQDQITELQKVWKTIGFAPKKDNNRIYERFRAACDKFFAAKRAFFGTMRSEMDENLQVKTDLCVMAETLCESDDWKATTDALIELQKRWKASGAVSRRHSDAIWKRFRAACDKFFERKSAHFKDSDSSYADNLAAKLAIIDELAALESAEDLSFDKLKEVMGRFTAIGFVPIKQKESVSKKYKEVVDRLFERLRAAEGSSRIERYKERVGQMRTTSGAGRVSSERDKLYKKMKDLQAEIATLENNIGFFAKSKNAGALVEGVERKIEKIRAEVEQIVAKIALIDQN